MRNLLPPTDENSAPLKASEVFDLCTAIVRNAGLRERLREAKTLVANHSNNYDAKAANGKLYEIEPNDAVGAVSGAEMVKVYTGRMVPKAMPGRSIYDRIISQPLHGVCPFCGVGTVNTLDHYLPKTHFPVFSVTPNNLVPACTWCQGTKDDYFPKTEEGQIVHPYFDNLDDEVWLVANVVKSAPAAFQFSVASPDCWSRAKDPPEDA
jgi:hypothetical protein